MSKTIIGVIGAGAMGSGIVQVAASHGHKVRVYESNKEAVQRSVSVIEKILARQVEKGSLSPGDKKGITDSISYVDDLGKLDVCNLIIEAISENLESKRVLFSGLEKVVTKDCILATNTSSLSIASIGSACQLDQRVIGIHFFNPAALMPLVEVIPSVATSDDVLAFCTRIVESWGKTAVIAMDSPGFIVNRVARPYYGEALRILEEGIADIATIDQAMKDKGFRMGPFELMDYIGNDINFTVTESIFREFYFDPRYKPSFTQKRMFESGRLGKKSGRGYYDYSEGAVKPTPSQDAELKENIFMRILVMLINEAADALYLGVASKNDIDLAMTKGVNYPKGLLKWADEIGAEKVLKEILGLQATYLEDRYRPSRFLRDMAAKKKTFF